MNGFIQLTDSLTLRPVYIRPKMIASVGHKRQESSESAIVTLVSADSYDVLESVQTVMDKISAFD